MGFINASVGGTSIKLWMDRALQMSQPAMRGGVENDEQNHAKFDEAAEMKNYHASLRYKDWQAAVEKAKAAGQPWPRQPYTPVDRHKGWLAAGTWFKVKIAPLIPYGLRGVVWYQGEADGSIPNGLRQRGQLPAPVCDWCVRWGDPDLPFGLVQLPFWKATATTWPAMRESQLRTQALPQTGLVVAFDIGDPNDVHPNDKMRIGHHISHETHAHTPRRHAARAAGRASGRRSAT